MLGIMNVQGKKGIVFTCMMAAFLTMACEKPSVQEPSKSVPVVTQAMPRPAESSAGVISGQPREPVPESERQDPAATGVPDDPGMPVQAAAPGPVAASLENYVPKSRLDPFLALIQEKKDTPVPERQRPEKPQRMLTPLEKMTLSEIKLVAVVMMGDRKIAMVEEATGKGYELGIGTYMGKDEGQVVDILLDKIVVKETITDYRGHLTERLQEIKLRKHDEGE
jgi:type IV pilus assembly protein PilP